MARNTDIFYENSEILITSKAQEMDFNHEKLFVEHGQEELPRPESVTVGVIQEEDSDADPLFAQVSLDVDPLYVEERLVPLVPKEPTLVLVKKEPHDEADNQEVSEDEEEEVAWSDSVSKESTEVEVSSTLNVQKGKDSWSVESESSVVKYKASVPKTNAEGKLVVLLTRCKVAERLLGEPEASFHSIKEDIIDIHEEIDDQTSANEEEIVNENSMLSVSREQIERAVEENNLDHTEAPAETMEEPSSLGLRVEDPRTVAQLPEMDTITREAVGDSCVEKKVLRCIDCLKPFELQSSLIGHRPRCRERKRKLELLVEPRSKCSLCGKIFNKKSSLLDHMSTHSSHDSLPFRCVVCKQCFSSSIDLVTHSRVHVTIQQFECEECQRRFGSMKALRLHKTKSHNQRKSCVPKITGNVESNLNEYVSNTGILQPLSSPLGNEIASQNLERVIQNSGPNKNTEMEAEFHCNICNEVFSTCQNLNDHGIIHARQLLQPYFDGTAEFCRKGRSWCCPVCAKTRSNKGGLKQHMRLHLNIKPFKCHVCRKSFIHKYLMNRHIEKEHSEEKTHSSNIRGIVYKNPNTSRLRKHLHKQSNPFLCRYCGKFFSSQHHLNAHKCSDTKQKLVHSSADKMIHTTKLHWKAHLSNSKDHSQGVDIGPKYTPKMKYTCSTCGKTFTSKSSLNLHMYLHTGKPHKCDLCKKRFSTLLWLDNHIRTQHGDERPYKCNLRDRTYCRPDSLSLPKRLFHQQKLAKQQNVIPRKQEHKCFECNSVFSTFGYLKRHNNSYHPTKETETDHLFISNVERFPCDNCGITCSSPSNLNLHCRRFHSGKSEEKDISNFLRIQSHSSKRIYKCDKCDAIFTTSGHLRIHNHSIHKVKNKVMTPFPSQSRDRYICYHCDTTFSSNSNLLAHSRRYHKDKENEMGTSVLQSQTSNERYKCNYCNIICSSLSSLQIHNRFVHKKQENKTTGLISHTDGKRYKCDFCDISCSTRDSLRVHCYKFHKAQKSLQTSKKSMLQSSKFHSIEKRFKCHSCNEKFISRSYLQSHINIVHGKRKAKIFANQYNSRGQTYRCDHCNLVCRSRSGLLNHVCVSHDSNENLTVAKGALTPPFISNYVTKVHSCDKCEETFNDIHHLIKHICNVPNRKSKEKNAFVVQSRKKTYKCEVCSAIFLEKYKLLKHNCNLKVQKKSSNEFLSETELSNQFKKDCRKLCLVCGESFMLLNELKDHMLIHTTQEPSFNCLICSKTFLTARKLANHSRTHNQLRRKLVVSSPFFNSLKAKNEAGARAPRKYKCKLCDKVLSNSASLKRHMMIHTNERPYSCEVCGQGYREHNKLVLHMRKHVSGDYIKTSFKCVICDKTFLKKGNLIRHQSVCN